MISNALGAGLLSAFLIAQTFAQAPEQRALSIEERVVIPAAGCDNGQPIPNLIIPDQGGPKPNCLSRGKPSSLKRNTRARINSSMAEVGTLVVVGLSREQVVLAADSRSGRFEQEKFKRVDDSRCKLVKLSPTMMFAATGQTARTGPVQSKVYYDAQKLAQSAVRNFVFDPRWMEPEDTVIELASKWAWDVAFRITRAVKSKAYDPPQDRTWLTGIFAGTATSGDISVAIAKLEYDKPQAGKIVPTVSLSIWVPVLPKDFTWIEAFGHEEIARQYYSTKSVTKASRSEFERIRHDQLRNPREFPAQVIQRLAELARDGEPHRYSDGSQQVGGKIDVAQLFRGGTVTWMDRKRTCPPAGVKTSTF